MKSLTKNISILVCVSTSCSMTAADRTITRPVKQVAARPVMAASYCLVQGNGTMRQLTYPKAEQESITEVTERLMVHLDQLKKQLLEKQDALGDSTEALEIRTNNMEEQMAIIAQQLREIVEHVRTMAAQEHKEDKRIKRLAKQVKELAQLVRSAMSEPTS